MSGRPAAGWRAVALLPLAMLGRPNSSAGDAPIPVLTGRLVAAGIPGAGAVSAVGSFLPGGPIHDKPSFSAFTGPGAVLDPERILVASRSNFGAPVQEGLSAGSVLSIDPRGNTPITIPENFAAAGGQARAHQGRVILFTASSPAFLNRIYNSGAVTADLAPVAGPTAISLNNAFGRVWITSMPTGLRGPGLHSVIDPDGRPLNGAPNKVAGGVFTGAVTNRAPQLVEGSMATGALATALLGKSPDGSGRAVFAGLNADGSLVQVHVERGVDGLAPAGTITPLENARRGTRSGMVLNWVPDLILYVADPLANSIVVLGLRSDGTIYRVESTHRLRNEALDLPVDLAPAVAEVVNPGFSSNTTLAGDADLYVVNRGNGTIVRLKQNGSIVAIRRIRVQGMGQLGPGQLNGIAVSPDARRIWVTVTGRLPGYPEGAVIEVPAFGGPGSSMDG